MVIHPTKGEFDESRAVWEAQPPGGDVGVAKVDGLWGMRNLSDPEGEILVFDQEEWDAFIGGVQDGEFDPV